MGQLTSLEIHYLIEEFKELIDSKVDKIYNPSKKELLINFYVSGKGKKLLRVLAPNFIFLTNKKESAEKPSGFCMFLRKILEGARLKEIKQIGSERVVELCFETKDNRYFLITELFSKGNIVLCDKEHKIIALAEKQRWKDRIVEIREKYKYPKKEYDFFKIKEDELSGLFKRSNKESVVKALAIELGLGGEYAEEACILANVNKNKKLKELENEEIKSLLGSIRKMADKKMDNLSAKVEASLKRDNTPVKSKEHEKTINIIKKQEEHLAKVRGEIEENNKKAELIYQKYQLVKEIIDEIRKAKDKYSWKEIEERIKGNKTVKKVIPKESKVIIEI